MKKFEFVSTLDIKWRRVTTHIVITKSTKKITYSHTTNNHRWLIWPNAQILRVRNDLKLTSWMTYSNRHGGNATNQRLIGISFDFAILAVKFRERDEPNTREPVTKNKFFKFCNKFRFYDRTNKLVTRRVFSNKKKWIVFLIRRKKKQTNCTYNVCEFKFKPLFYLYGF